jgi:hypothetical protein
MQYLTKASKKDKGRGLILGAEPVTSYELTSLESLECMELLIDRRMQPTNLNIALMKMAPQVLLSVSAENRPKETLLDSASTMIYMTATPEASELPTTPSCYKS